MGAAIFWFVVEMALTGPMPFDALTSPRAWQQRTQSYQLDRPTNNINNPTTSTTNANVAASSSSSSSSSSLSSLSSYHPNRPESQAYLERIVLIGFTGKCYHIIIINS